MIYRPKNCKNVSHVHQIRVFAHLLPASFSDDHLGSDLIEPLPQLGALQLHSDLSVRTAVALHRLPLLAGRLGVLLGLRSVGLRVSGRCGSTCLLRLTTGIFTWKVGQKD